MENASAHHGALSAPEMHAQRRYGQQINDDDS
jgi:hypothetical protein